MAGKYWADAVTRLEIRKRALELAIEAAGPSSPGYSATEIADRAEALADRLFIFMTMDDPARTPAKTAAALKETE